MKKGLVLLLNKALKLGIFNNNSNVIFSVHLTNSEMFISNQPLSIVQRLKRLKINKIWFENEGTF
ncbi:hypothetical protein BpHYR1_051343 [Brachionus plicatilis]|uniref:Uncharacterized protein n=1 Tax=Brachionus plicatilis TaxID=10195 RepID=A0A3M7PCM0_BRAPC|nr:hypothetical protein BpHYR1_051343 [Brachionus plicatilis]